MNQNKKKNKNKIIFILLLIAILAVMIFGFTYSKFLSIISLRGDFSVANWSIKVNPVDGETTTDLELNTYQPNPATVIGKLSPDTHGYFDIVIDATGTETSIDYEIRAELDPEERHVPRNFFLNRGFTYFQNSDFDNHPITGTIYYDDEDKVVKDRIYWNWTLTKTLDWITTPAELYDQYDTEDAAAFQDKEAYVILKVIATQSLKVRG